MNVLVETSEELPIICVARYIGDLNQGNEQRTELADSPAKLFVSSCEALMEQGAWSALLGEMLSNSSVLFSKASESDVECCFLVMSSVFSKLPQQEALAAAEMIGNKIANETGVNNALRLRLLQSLFNMMQYPYGKFVAFLQIVNFATHAQMVDSLLPAIKKTEVWVKEWSVGVEESRALYLAVANLCSGQASASKEYFHFLTKYLSTFETTELASDKIRRDVARCGIEFISSPDVFQCDTLDLVTVQKLQADSVTGPVFVLLSLMLTGKLADYLTFHAANPKVVAGLSLSHDNIVSKMRLMSLTALASESQTGEIPYALVKDTLQIEDSEVEAWIVKAISLKLLEAKIDQLREVVVFSRCTRRVFGDAQWHELQAKLGQWKANLGSVCKMMHNTRTSGVALSV